MINLNPTKPVWLIPEAEIGRAFSRSAAAVWETYHNMSGAYTRSSSAAKLKSIFGHTGTLFYLEWDKETAERCLSACFWKGNKDLSQVDEVFKKVTTSLYPTLINFYKSVFVHLWIKKTLLVPLNLTSASLADDLLDAICENSGIEILKMIRSVNPNSKLRYVGKIDFEARNHRATFWLRLLMGTDFYSTAAMNFDDCKTLFDNTMGEGDLALRRYYTIDFLLTVANNNSDKNKIIELLSNTYKAAVRDVREQVKETANKERLERASKPRKTRKVRDPRNAEDKISTATTTAAEYANGDCDLNIDELIKILKPLKVKIIFNIESSDVIPIIYQQLPKKVWEFCVLINAVFKGAIKSKRLQREDHHLFMVNVLLGYISIYLTRFYTERDGNLNDFPKTLNDFQCSLFITRDSLYLDAAIQLAKKPPMTFLDYLGKYRRVCDWGHETFYARVLITEQFFDYVVRNQALIPDADMVTNTFSPGCYPKLQKKTGTVKKTLPRAYFGAFVSMLYSLEYFVMHLNEMALGNMPGVINSELYQPTYLQMCEHYQWKSLWGNVNQSGMSLDLSLLNYCPIFYHDGCIHKIEFLPCFFRRTEYEIDGEKIVLATPNDIRTIILMCETGIRQNHIIWLDKEKYDCAIDRSSKSQLAPLFVSSDKSHGEWTAIVSRHVIEVMDRQRSWYDLSGPAEYQENLWYGLRVGSKFGQYKPLFRLPIGSKATHAHNWTNNRSFPLCLLALQYFMKAQLKEDDCEDLVLVKSKDGEKKEIVDYSHESLNTLTSVDISSKYTPHGLRASFISEAIRFLPPSIIGQYMTGQTEELVWYYSIFDPKDMPDHQQLLANYLTKNMENLSKVEAPELADAILKLNARLMTSIETDPSTAIKTHGLMSLAGIKEDQTGISVLRAKRYTRLAFNSCHICPFNNSCPKEVVEMLGHGRPCALCPYAIRGVDHLPAVSAEKDKCKEIMIGILKKITEYQKLDPKSRSKQDLESLEMEHDRYAREAYALEAIEQQLYVMAETGQYQSFFLPNKDGLVSHYKKVNLTGEQHLVKRLIDVQNFPDATSPALDAKFAYMRAILLMKDNNPEELLKLGEGEGTPASLLSSQIGAMVTAGHLEVMDMFKIGQLRNSITNDKPTAVITKQIGLEVLL